MKSFRYTIQEKELKGMGYIFQKLYAGDYKSYRLEVEKYAYTIWLWVSGKSIEVNDWYGHTYDVIEFYKANRDSEKFSDKDYIKVNLNRQTGDVSLNTRWEELSVIMKTKDDDAMQKYLEKYESNEYLSDIYLSKEKMDRLIIEIEKLNPVAV